MNMHEYVPLPQLLIFRRPWEAELVQFVKM